MLLNNCVSTLQVYSTLLSLFVLLVRCEDVNFVYVSVQYILYWQSFCMRHYINYTRRRMRVSLDQFVKIIL